MLMTASKEYSLGKAQDGRHEYLPLPNPVSEGIFNSAVLRGPASMILLSLPQRHFLFHPFFICQAAFKQQIYMRKP